MSSEKEYRRDIQVLRGLAVLAVVIFHFKESYFPLGYLGVDVFFVISGFVVTPLILQIFSSQSSWAKRLYNLRYFYKRRFYRLAPALAVTLVLSAMTMFLLGPMEDHQRIYRQGIATLLLLGNVGAYKYSGDYFSPNPNPLVHTWSLSVEEQIYIILPIILMLLLHKFRDIRKITTVVIGVIFTLSFVSFLFPIILESLYSQVGIDTPSQFSFYSPIDRIWQFGMGGLVFLLQGRNQKRISKIPNGIKFLTVITVVMVLFSPIHLSQKVSSILASFFAVTVILLKSLDMLPNLLIHKLVWIGDRSYSIYLVHMPLLYLAKYSPATQIGNIENRIFQSTLAVICSILLGALIYSKIENKYRNKGKTDYLSLKTIAVSQVVTLVVPFIVFVSLDLSSAAILKKSGIPVPSKILPWNWDTECQFFSPQPNINNEPCRYGNSDSGKSILLIGDSHAASISRAIISLGDSNQMDTFVFTFQGCGFVLSNRDFNPSYSYPYLTPNCLKHNQSILHFIQKNKPTVVIYANRSSSIMVSPNNFISRSHYKGMIAKNLEVLMQENIDVIHIGSTPELLPYRTVLQDGLSNRIIFSKIPFEDNIFWKNNRATDYYLNTLDIFCSEKVCLNNSSEGWLFHDGDHLSEIGANRLIPKLDSLIKEILNKER